MTRLHRFWVRNTRCRITTHELDWLWQQMCGARRCANCEATMPAPHGPPAPPPPTPGIGLPETLGGQRRRTVGETFPDCGD